ncbi:unnamed protein product [Adineta steineri]|uniref:Arrestin C-terminal-like domain-containing protein n=1 Tax=Adineta steineri TaxID=433720 RepID=A0A819N2E2_9BILA|nr:unnamed protein product [Adineta steineri]CAF3988945.1 unnamed protein product [Adineta steineri]
MGIGNISQGSIHLNQAKKCYPTGDIISGTVDLNPIRAKQKVIKIYVELIGEIGCTRTEYYAWGREVLPTATTTYHHPKFYKDTVILIILNVEQDIIGQFKNLECLEPIHKTYNEKNVILYVPGEVIYMTLQIENLRKALVQRIDLSMIKRRTNKIKILENAYIDISYKLELTIKIQGIFNDFYVDIPVTLGPKPNPNFNQQQIFNPMVINDYSMFNDDDLPPGYDSAVQNSERLGVQD